MTERKWRSTKQRPLVDRFNEKIDQRRIAREHRASRKAVSA